MGHKEDGGRTFGPAKTEPVLWVLTLKDGTERVAHGRTAYEAAKALGLGLSEAVDVREWRG